MIIQPIETAPIITDMVIEKGRAKGIYTVRLMKEGQVTWVTPEKARDLWVESKKHDVLFTDYTQGNPKAFLRALAKKSSVWFEVLKDGHAVGILYMSHIIPHFDGVGHFAFWDKVGRGREPLILDTLKHMFYRYNLQRVSAEVPVYQLGTIRLIKRLGFTEEGRRRNGVIYKESWADQILFGILRSELITVEVETGPEEVA